MSKENASGQSPTNNKHIPPTRTHTHTHKQSLIDKHTRKQTHPHTKKNNYFNTFIKESAHTQVLGNWKISKLDGCYKNEIGRKLSFYRSGILDERAMQRKGSTKFFLKSQVSQIKKEHKMSIPIKPISLNEHKMSNPNITGEF